MTLLELTATLVVLSLISGAVLRVVMSMRGLGGAGGAQIELQRTADRALASIVDDLRQSGFTLLGANQYPHLFEGGDAGDGFDVHDHPPAVQVATEDEYDFGPMREVVFLRPADLDGDDVPDVDGDGQLVWNPNELSYVVVTRADGINYLERRTNGAAPQRICPYVERVVFDDAASTIGTPLQVPVDALRVQLFLRRPDLDGTVHRYFVEATVRLRNGSLAGG